MLTSLTPSETVPSPTGWQGEDGGYHTWKDLDFGEGKVRFHRFLTGREDEGVKPVYGLTAYVSPSLSLY
jgi:coenzyme A diphosphatase NUDT7